MTSPGDRCCANCLAPVENEDEASILTATLPDGSLAESVSYWCDQEACTEALMKHAGELVEQIDAREMVVRFTQEEAADAS
jgi:hypothetical protein